jgi:hypothetical protein
MRLALHIPRSVSRLSGRRTRSFSRKLLRSSHSWARPQPPSWSRSGRYAARTTPTRARGKRTASQAVRMDEKSDVGDEMVSDYMGQPLIAISNLRIKLRAPGGDFVV